MFEQRTYVLVKIMNLTALAFVSMNLENYHENHASP